MKQQLKQKKNKKKEYLEKIVNKKTEKLKYFISNYIIVNENHKDESLHKYAYIKLDKKIQIRKETFFDIKLEDETIYHPNIQGVQSTKALAKEYPKTYTLYNKRLIDWKTKIEEQLYKSLGKPFVEFHYGDKMCGKSSYAENFDEKIAYWFDNKNWFDEIKGSKELNYIKHVIITSNYSLKELYRKDDYNRDQLDWYFDAIWNYKKSQDTFSERKYSEINNDNYLPIEKIRTILAKRNKNNQSDSETSSINSQDSENTKRYKQKKSKTKVNRRYLKKNCLRKTK
ncbi:hypothetical protein C2G38_2163224 [Gigaspora rosea]|uniref:CRESS-DNA virus Rep endonuclease domain-containing protein n=1 Tax=Gigaspora rosea TaxID=44941 RepID=A0A397VX22_9GLOM|nr:hypothetical protein C2G38_2163224 [Gigaspora rosea]